MVASRDRGSRFPSSRSSTRRCQGIAVEDGETFYERISGRIAIESLEPGDLVLAPERWPRFQLAIGRAVNVAVAAAALLLLAPVFALVACAIVIDSDRPCSSCSNERLKGRPFRLLKFAPCVPRRVGPPEWVAHEQRHRITRGPMAAQVRLDELPQLINILRGEMNFVGPRPHPRRTSS